MILIVIPHWGGLGVRESGGHPRRAHQPPAAGPCCLRPLREQVAERCSHLDVQEQLVLIVAEMVAPSPRLSLTVMAPGFVKDMQRRLPARTRTGTL